MTQKPLIQFWGGSMHTANFCYPSDWLLWHWWKAEGTFRLKYENGHTRALAQQHRGGETRPGNNQSCWMPDSSDGSQRITQRHMVNTFIYKTRCDRFLKQLVSSISSQRPMFNLILLHKQFMVDEVALGQVFLQVLQFSLVSIISSVLHAHSFIHSFIHSL